MTDTPPITLEIDSDKIAWLTFDLPGSKVNLLTTEVLTLLDRRLSELESRIATGHPVAVVVRSGKEGTFIAGADVREIDGVLDAEDGRAKAAEGQRIFRRLDRLTVPTIAAIDGTCLGGGTELALSCDWRLASDRSSTKIGLPEIRLGIIPGFGGSVRLPRLIGIQRALRMILTGTSIAASRAARWGLVDRVLRVDSFEKDVCAFAMAVVLGQSERRERRPSLRDRLLEDTGPGRRLLFGGARKRVMRESRGRYPAALEAISVVERTIDLQIDDALALEAQALGRMAETEVSKNLVRLFLLSQDARKALDATVLASGRDVEKAAVLGAGVMGGGIAELIAAHDIPVVLKDIDRDALDTGLRHANDLLQKAGARGVFAADEVGLKFALIHGTLTYEKFDDVDLVVEAVVERMPVKQSVLREAEGELPEHAVFATNTSSLSVRELADAAGRPANVVGLHFFNPVHRMPLIEVIRTERSSDAALATAFRFVGALGKTPVLVADRPGFLVNRLLAPYLNEAGFLLEDGAGVAEVDQALTSFGMPMGPCRLLDEVGFDVAEHVAKEMERAFGSRMRPAPVVGLLQGEGRLGKKNGRGFYSYAGGKERGVDREVERTLGGSRGAVGETEILDRTLLLLVNEAMHALAEDVVASPGDVDLAMVLGTGFPPFRGGLLRWADTRGPAEIRDRLAELEEKHGERFAAAPALLELVESGATFTS
ncbi:MAG: 3-hydroxyacyl-CoA dehydrogenase NAD-binding domain-containing protein [Gemmatimonadetes bacterium]|nr:3-hydroxyacyl-CoA dehydrogenase NAD-binding domain-containing protein [Gemmatimonadota bacterium]